ncbi:MAG TPA: zf-HC2 domain-containing protein [Verrucomicrobiae bacterium]|nr:zf-HC2 domain-containing protein [Verrucomicrobiae bacterium]
MNCPLWEERIALYAGGDLSGGDAALVRQHLAACPECAALAAELRSHLELFRIAHAEPIAEGHFTAVRARVLEKLAGEKRPWWRHKPACLAAAAAMMIAILIVARPHSPTMPQPRAQARTAPAPPAVPGPAAPPPVKPRRPHRLLASATGPTGPAAPVEPLVVKLVTDDPDVVIYWIADK